MRCDTLWRDARLATMTGDGLGIVEGGVIAACDGRILFAGAAEHAPSFQPERTINCEGRWITPGLVDCHTHLVFAGSRAYDFELRLAGATYEEIARAGGGILSTVRATRAASDQALRAQTLKRLDQLIAEGVTTLEIKSGYGLSTDSEMRLLTIARELPTYRPIHVTTTFLGAHACPPEFADNDSYIDHVCSAMLPAIAEARLADAVDGFCETIAFTPTQIERVFCAAQKAGLPVKLHAEQLSNQGASALAARYGALSADHLEHLDDDGVAALKRCGATAVLLPGAFYFTRETKSPPVEALRAAGVPIAVATDCNPGTSPLASPLTALNMAATLFRLTVPECLRGMTINAARALGMHADRGALEAGKICDLAIWDIERPADLVYLIAANPLHARVWRGA